MPVAPGAVAGDGVELEELPAVEAATLLYKGPYDGMEPSWRSLMEWVGTSGRQPGGPMREIYLSDPETSRRRTCSPSSSCRWPERRDAASSYFSSSLTSSSANTAWKARSFTWMRSSWLWNCSLVTSTGSSM